MVLCIYEPWRHCFFRANHLQLQFHSAAQNSRSFPQIAASSCLNVWKRSEVELFASVLKLETVSGEWTLLQLQLLRIPGASHKLPPGNQPPPWPEYFHGIVFNLTSSIWLQVYKQLHSEVISRQSVYIVMELELQRGHIYIEAVIVFTAPKLTIRLPDFASR